MSIPSKTHTYSVFYKCYFYREFRWMFVGFSRTCWNMSKLVETFGRTTELAQRVQTAEFTWAFSAEAGSFYLTTRHSKIAVVLCKHRPLLGGEGVEEASQIFWASAIFWHRKRCYFKEKFRAARALNLFMKWETREISIGLFKHRPDLGRKQMK